MKNTIAATALLISAALLRAGDLSWSSAKLDGATGCTTYTLIDAHKHVGSVHSCDDGQSWTVYIDVDANASEQRSVWDDRKAAQAEAVEQYQRLKRNRDGQR